MDSGTPDGSGDTELTRLQSFDHWRQREPQRHSVRPTSRAVQKNVGAVKAADGKPFEPRRGEKSGEEDARVYWPLPGRRR
jgi:hypothetical protein